MTRVTYDGNGHTEGSVPIDTHDYTSDEYAVAAHPGTMKRDGAVFSHWMSSLTGGSYAPGQRMFPTASLTLRAVWTPRCTIIYDTSTGLCVNGDVPVDSTAYAIGDTATVPMHSLITAYIAAVGKKDAPESYTLEGMQTCIGWKILAGGKSSKDVLVSGDTFTVTAQTVILQTVWGSPTISVAYEVGNDVKGTDIPVQSAQQFRPVKILDLPADTVKYGFTFAHWQDLITGITYQPGEEATFPSSTMLQAVWYPNTTHTVTYDLAGGYGDIPPQDPVDYGSFIVLPSVEPFKSGYGFGGWIVPGGDYPICAVGGMTVQVTSDLTIVARWVPTDATKTFKLTYASTEPDIISAEGLPEDDGVYVSGDYAFALPWSPGKLGRHVSRWIDDKGTVYEFGSPILFTSSSITLTAVWEDDPLVTIKFLPNARNVSGSVPDITTRGNSAIVLPSSRTYTREGYDAVGWLILVNGVPTGERYDSGMIYQVPAPTAQSTEIQFGVEWIDTTATHSVKYEDILHDFGHLPVDQCVYHAGDLIPLPPAGDLRRTGYRLAGWVDSDTQKFYKIPSPTEIESFLAMDEAVRGDYGYLCPNAVCRGDHVFHALWVPTTILYFGALGAMYGRAPSPVELTADEVYYLPDGGTLLGPEDKILVGWREDTPNGKRYHVGSKYVYTGKSRVVLQPVWETYRVVEYVVPEELNVVNSSWIPENKHVVGRNTVHVDVPSEMNGRYCWMRSDTGEKVTESCDIEISGDLILTLIPLYTDPSEYPRCVQRIDYGTHVSTVTAQIGQETILEPVPGQTGWRVGNDSRIYGVNEPIVPHGNTVYHAVYGNTEEGDNSGIHIIYEMPEDANSNAPVDYSTYTYGEFALIPPHNGMRGPNGTNLLFWYTLSKDTTKENKFVDRYYPGEMIGIPSLEDPDGIVQDRSRIILHPFFGDKFGIAFADPSNCIMPISPSSGKAEYVYPTLITDGMLIRTPKMVEQTRDEKSYTDWVNAWEYPYKGTSDTTNETIYVTRFEGKIIDDDEYGGELGGFFSSLCTIVKVGAWLITNVVKPAAKAISGVLKTVCDTVKELTSSDHNYDLVGDLSPEEVVDTQETVVTQHAGLFHSDKADTNVVVENIKTKSTECIGYSDSKTGRVYANGEKIMHAGKNATFKAVYDNPIRVWYQKEAGLIKEELLTYFYNIRHYICPDWTGSNKFLWQETFAKDGDAFSPPLYGKHFKAKYEPSKTHESKNGDERYLLCDRWFPMIADNGTDKLRPHPALRNYTRPLSSDDMWLWARNDINGFSQANSVVKIPKPDDPVYGKYFRLIPENYWREAPHSRQFTHTITYALRWAPVVKITYEYKVSKFSWFTDIAMPRTAEVMPNFVGSTPRLGYETEVVGGILKDFERVVYGDTSNLYFQGWKMKPGTPAFKYYSELYQKEGGFNPSELHDSGSYLPALRVDSPTVIPFEAVYRVSQHGSEIEYEKKPTDAIEHPKVSSKVRDISQKQANTVVDLSTAESAKNGARGQESQNQNTARKESNQGGFFSQVFSMLNNVDDFSNTRNDVNAVITASIAAVAYKNYDTYMTQPEYVESLGSPSLRRRRMALAGIPPESSDSVGTEEDEAVTVRLMMDPERKAARDEIIRDESNTTKASDAHMNQSSIFVPAGLCNRIEPHLALSAEGPIPKKGGAAGVYGATPMSERTAAYPEQELYSQLDTIPEESRQGTVNMLTGMVGADPHASPNCLRSAVGTARLQTLARYIKDRNSQMFGVIPSRTSIKSGYIIVDAAVDTDAKARCLNTGWSETLHVDTLSPTNGVDIPMLTYTPRDPSRTDVHFPGETVIVPEGKRICRVDFVTFANDYDDNIPGYFDAETRTYDSTFLEPHEYHTVLECNVPAEHRPAGMVFAGWVLDANGDTATATVVQPGDKIKQGTVSHRLRALWLPKNPTRFGDIND